MTKNGNHRRKSSKEKGTGHYVLRLYVAGLTTRSSAAIRNVRAICDAYLSSDYDLKVIDICEHPAAARGEQIIAAPTLVKQSPLPVRRLIGDMSDEGRVLSGLDIAIA